MSLSRFVDKLINNECINTGYKILDDYLKEYANKCIASGFSDTVIKQHILMQILFDKQLCSLINRL